MPAERSSGYFAYAVLGTLYALLLGGVIGGSFYARTWAISVYESPEAQAEWEEWREGAARLSIDGPVKRRAPRSDKPPALILATTYFKTCLTIALVLTTVLFATAAFFVHGVWTSPGAARNESQRAPRGAEKRPVK